MQRSEACNEIFAALAKAQGLVQGAHKDSTNPHFRSKYADLESCWDACREALSGNGLCVTQEVVTVDGGASVTTLLGHASGQWIEYAPLFVPCLKVDAHGVGSSATYAARYSLCRVVGIAPTDDDGNEAVKPTGNAPQDQRQPNRGPNREPPKMPPQAPKAQAKAPEPPPRDDSDPGPAGVPAAVVAAAVHPEVPETRVVLDAEADKPKPTTLVELKKQIKAALANGVTMDDLRAMGLRVTNKSGAEIQKSESASQAFLAALAER